MGGVGVLIVIVIIRVVLSYQGQQPSTWLTVRPSFLAAALRFALLIGAYGVWANGGPTWLIGLLLLAAVPNLLIQGLVISSGIPGLAFALTRALRPPGVGTENYSAAVLNELRARLRWGWLLDDERLLRLSRPLRRGDRIDAARGATVAVRATLDALKGDFEHARPLFALAMEMRHSPRNVRCYCQAWLLADAAKRADYVEVLRLSWRGPRTRRRRFLRACAERLLLQELHNPALLLALWLFAPGRRQGLGLLRLALSRQSAEPLPKPAESLAAARDVAAHLMAPGALASRERVRQAAQLWQGVLDRGELRSWVESRALAIDANIDVDATAARVERAVIGVLADRWQAAPPSPAEDEPDLLLTAIDDVRSHLFDEVEQLVSELNTGEQRSNGETEQHFRRWAEVRRLMSRYAALFPNDKDLFYDSFGAHVLNHGVWLNNRELAYSFGYDVFRFLSTFLDKEHESQALLKSNMKIAARSAAQQ